MKLKYWSDRHFRNPCTKRDRHSEIWMIVGAPFRMYPPNVTAQYLGRMDFIYKNDKGNKNLKHAQGEKIHRQRSFSPFFFS